MNQTERIRKKCDSLSQLIGSACLPFSSSEGLDQANYDVILSAGFDLYLIEQLCEEVKKCDAPIIVSTSNSESVFAIPIENGPDRWYAIGKNPFPATDPAVRLIKAAHQSMQLQLELVERDHALYVSESELNRSFAERAWLRDLSSMRASQKRPSSTNIRRILESVRRLIDVEAVGVFLCEDQDSRRTGLESMITSHATWTVEDIRYLIQKLPKPELGDVTLESHLSLKVRRGVVYSAVVTPIGDTSVIGYVVACNRLRGSLRTTGPSFDSSDTQILLEVADYLVAEGFTNKILQESEELVLGTLRAMSTAIEARDPYTHGHSERVAEVGFAIAHRLNLSEESCQEIYLAGVLHDIGKIGIPDNVLLKPGKLEADEYAVIQKHPEIGYKIIDELGKLKFVLPGVLYHHERFDGLGYPHRLKGEEIPLMARILAVSDAYDAMTSSRIYRTAMAPTRAAQILRDGAGIQWDQRVVDACLDWIDEKHLALATGESDSRNSASPGRLLSQALRTVQL